MLERRDLAGTWSWRVDPTGPSAVLPEAAAHLGERIDARVPGALLPDLQSAGLIPDPSRDLNELAVQWVGRTDWILDRSFDGVAPAERVDLVLDGIDTVAELAVNDVALGRVRNMHRSYRYDVRDLLRERENNVEVRFTSSYTEAESQERRLGERPNAYPQPFNYIRTMACSFGWDWGPTLVSAGLWRGVRLESWGIARISSIRPLVTVVGATGVLTLHVEIERAASGLDRTVDVEVTVAGATERVAIEPGADSASVVVRVPDVRRWEPAGVGDAELSAVAVSLSVDDQPLDARSTRVGFRTVDVDRRPDELGTPFVLEVNSRPLFVKGINWIPDSIHPGTLSREDVRRRLTQAVDAGVNLVRVWGGGVYESDDFYDICDELGLLVWQDFLFACASYAEDEPLWSEVMAEARENVARLSTHPSLVLWCGTNENLWMHGDKDWPAQRGGLLTWGERYYLEMLPSIVAELDPTRPYTAGSPWSGSWAHDPNDADHETFHSWDVWNSQDFAHYRDSAPRFVSEFGWQGAAAWRTLRDAVGDDPLAIDSPGIRHHQKAIDGHTKMTRGLATHFEPARSFDVWHFQTQWTQVEAIRTGILHWRAQWPRTSGTILWQLNDVWPAVSWSVVDSAGRPKPAYFALREVYRDRVITIEPVPGGGLELCVINDADEIWAGVAELRRIRVDGAIIERALLEVEAVPRSVARVRVPTSLSTFEESSVESLVVDVGDHRGFWHPAAPKDLVPCERAPSVSIVSVPGGLDISVTADTVTRDFLVQADRIHPLATVDRGFTTLLPGETVVYRVRADALLDPGTALGPFVVGSLQSVLHEERDPHRA